MDTSRRGSGLALPDRIGAEGRSLVQANTTEDSIEVHCVSIYLLGIIRMRLQVVEAPEG